MKKLNFTSDRNKPRILGFMIIVPLMVVVYQNCSPSNLSSSPSTSLSSVTPGTGSTGTTPTATGTSAGVPIVAGHGADVSGTGTLTCPTAQGVISQIQSVLGVSIATVAAAGKPASNANLAYGLLAANLPTTADCTKAGGFDSAQLFIYAACSDLTTGTTPMAQSKYNVNLAGTVASNQAALIAAGITILNGFTGGIAGSSNATAGITAALTTLVSSASTTTTSKIAFMDVCMAASSAGALLLGN